MGYGTLAGREQLLGERGYEPGVVARVASPQPPRLVGQPERPLEAPVLHPLGRLRDQPGVEVEGGADADEQRGVERVAHLRHPTLLLGLPGADPHDLRPRAVDVLRDPVLFLRRQVAIGRGVAADDLDAGELASQAERQLDERALVAPAVEVHAYTGLRRALAVARHQRR